MYLKPAVLKTVLEDIKEQRALELKLRWLFGLSFVVGALLAHLYYSI